MKNKENKIKYLFVINLPPPSINACYNGGGKGTSHRFASKTYKEWIASAKEDLEDQAPVPFKGRYKLRIMIPGYLALQRSRKRPRDVGNHLKQIVDILIKEGKIPDDQFSDSETIEFYSGDVCQVQVWRSNWSFADIKTLEGEEQWVIKALEEPSRYGLE